MKSKKFLGGLALGALIGSALGLFFTPHTGQKNREKFKKVSKKVSEQLIKDVASAKSIGKKEYEAIVENIIDKYSKDDLLDPSSWMEIASELKLRWTDVRKELTAKQKATKPKKTKKVAKKK